MKSYDVCECGAPLRLMERPTPKPVGTEVLLKIIAAGICHSDLHIWEGYYDLGGGKRLKLSDRGVKLPLTMGHENVGEVVAVGPDAAGVKLGGSAGSCILGSAAGNARCAGAATSRCAERHQASGCSAPAAMPTICWSRIRAICSTSATFRRKRPRRSLVLGITTYGALKKVGALLQEEPVVIIGAGGLGLMCLSLHKAMGGKGAIVVDIDPVKREAAKKAGAQMTVDASAPDAAKQIIAATERRRLGGDRSGRRDEHRAARPR